MLFLYVSLVLANIYLPPKVIKYSLVSRENKSKVMLSFFKEGFPKKLDSAILFILEFCCDS